MSVLNQLYAKLRGRKNPNFNLATKEDVRYCYRLILNREPDEGGMNFYKGLIDKQQITIQYLVDTFLNSVEYHEKQAKLSEAILVELPHFDMYVRLSDTFIGAAIYNTHTYEPHVSREIESHLKPGMTFVDIGANIGFFTLMGANLVGEDGQVFAFEPNPENCDLIRQSVEKNEFGNVNVYQNALAEIRQTFEFSVDSSNGRILHEAHTENTMANYTVQAITLDEVLPDLSRLDLIKMDIEGAEPRAWQGMTQTIKKYRPIIIFEFSPEAIQLTSQTKPEDFLMALQQTYNLFVLSDSGKKSSQSQSKEEIMQLLVDAQHHLDIVAYPR